VSKIAIKTIGIRGVSAKPRTLKRILKLRSSALPPLTNIVPTSDIITITVKTIPYENDFLRCLLRKNYCRVIIQIEKRGQLYLIYIAILFLIIQ
jgi:hypothetical protein